MLLLQLASATTELPEPLARDPKAATLSQELESLAGWKTGVEKPYTMEGGWRGKIEIVGQWPVRGHRVHLQRVHQTARDLDSFFKGLGVHGAPNYRWKDIHFDFFRSVGRKTPSAYAQKWRVGYNVNGSLLRSTASVRTTLFHEIFHLNDEARKWWSTRLKPIYQGIITRCTKGESLSNRCLAPYAPSSTKVRGSTYYAFHPGEGVEEYAAELALRYYTEHREVLAERKPKPPFKCRTAENQKAWLMLAEEFFGGIDLTPRCPGASPR